MMHRFARARLLPLLLLASSVSCEEFDVEPRRPIGLPERAPPRQPDPEVEYAQSPPTPRAMDQVGQPSWVYVSADGEWVFTANHGWIWLPPGHSVSSSAP
jgi:hypothetical protein